MFYKEGRNSGRLPSSLHRRHQPHIPTLWSLSFAVMHLFGSLSLFSYFAVDAPPHLPPCQHHDILGLCGVLTFGSCWEINYLSTFDNDGGKPRLCYNSACHVITAFSFFFNVHLLLYVPVFLNLNLNFTHFELHPFVMWCRNIRQTPALNRIELELWAFEHWGPQLKNLQGCGRQWSTSFTSGWMRLRLRQHGTIASANVNASVLLLTLVALMEIASLWFVP